MFYITPSSHDYDVYKHMTRIAMHVGRHTHPAKFMLNKDRKALLHKLLEEKVKNHPNAKLSVIKSETIKALQDIFEDKVVGIVTNEEARDLPG